MPACPATTLPAEASMRKTTLQELSDKVDRLARECARYKRLAVLAMIP